GPPFITDCLLTCISSERNRVVILPFLGGFRPKNESTGQSKLPGGSRFLLKLLRKEIGWRRSISRQPLSHYCVTQLSRLSARWVKEKRMSFSETLMLWYCLSTGRSHLAL